MRKRTVKARKKSPEPKVRKVVLSPDEVVRVHLPPGAAPVVVPVAPDVVAIVPAPAKKQGWWQSLFG